MVRPPTVLFFLALLSPVDAIGSEAGNRHLEVDTKGRIRSEQSRDDSMYAATIRNDKVQIGVNDANMLADYDEEYYDDEDLNDELLSDTADIEESDEQSKRRRKGRKSKQPQVWGDGRPKCNIKSFIRGINWSAEMNCRKKTSALEFDHETDCDCVLGMHQNVKPGKKLNWDCYWYEDSYRTLDAAVKHCEAHQQCPEYDEAACMSNETCHWNGASTKCQASLECIAHKDEATCPSYCTWNDGSCEKVPMCDTMAIGGAVLGHLEQLPPTVGVSCEAALSTTSNGQFNLDDHCPCFNAMVQFVPLHEELNLDCHWFKDEDDQETLSVRLVQCDEWEAQQASQNVEEAVDEPAATGAAEA